MHVVLNEQVRKKALEYYTRKMKNVEDTSYHSRISTRYIYILEYPLSIYIMEYPPDIFEYPPGTYILEYPLDINILEYSPGIFNIEYPPGIYIF